MSGVTIKYGGVTQATMTNSGTKMCKTGGLLCEHDVVIEYDKPVVIPPRLGEKTITQNGTYAASSDDLNGYSKVTVAVGAIRPNIAAKTIMSNGVYTASDDGKDGYSPVTVDVTGYKVYNDGKTHLYISVNEVTRSLSLGLCVNGSVTIDWGDGSAPSTLTGTNSTTTVRATHEYSDIGNYHIRISAATGTDYYWPANSAIFATTSGSTLDSYRCILTFFEAGDAKVSSSQTWRYCYGLRGAVFAGSFYLDSYAFHNCFGLVNVDITGASSIADSVFRNVNGLGSITIPATVTSIGSMAFRDCTGLRRIHFKSATPPTLGASDVFQNLHTACKIYVPTGSLAAYTSATNYPSASTYTYEEE